MVRKKKCRVCGFKFRLEKENSKVLDEIYHTKIGNINDIEN
jgi:hypothetical protein